MPELNRRQRRTVLAICCSSLFIVGLDTTIVNLALPAIQRDLGSSLTGLQWVIDAYTLVLASLLLLAGSTGDRVGRRRVFQIGLVTFSVGSLLCSVAPTTGALIGFRMLQAVGGSMLNPVAMSIITHTFPEPKERARAIGVWGAVIGLSFALGPVVGGLLVDGVGWRSVFWINVPIGLAAALLTRKFVPASRAERARRLDVGGQLAVMTVLATVVFAIIEGPGLGWSSPVIIGCLAAAAAATVTLLWVESHHPEPLVDLRFFGSLPFSAAILIAVGAFAALAGFLFLNALYLQSVRGYSPFHAGLLTLPLALMLAVLPPVSAWIVGTRGARIPLVVGGIGLAAGGLLLVGIDPQTPPARILVAYVVFGIGFGMLNAPITDTAVGGMPRSQAGTAAAVASTSRQVGAALGVAILGSLVTSRVTGPLPAAFAEAARPAWLVVAGCGSAVLVLGLISTTQRARRTAVRTAALFHDPQADVEPTGSPITSTP